MKIPVQIEVASQEEMARLWVAIAEAQASKEPTVLLTKADIDAAIVASKEAAHARDKLQAADPKGGVASAGQSPSAAATDAGTAGSPGATATTSPTAISGQTTATSTERRPAKNLRQLVRYLLEDHPDWKKEDVVRQCEMMRAEGNAVLDAVDEDDLPDRVEDACMAVWEKG